MPPFLPLQIIWREKNLDHEVSSPGLVVNVLTGKLWVPKSQDWYEDTVRTDISHQAGVDLPS